MEDIIYIDGDKEFDANEKVLDMRGVSRVEIDRRVLINTEHFKKPYEKLVYITLCMYANWETKESYPSVTTLAKLSCCGETSVREAIKKLEALKLIKIVKRFHKKSGRQMSNLYVLLPIPEIFYPTQDEGGRVRNTKGEGSPDDDELSLNITSIKKEQKDIDTKVSIAETSSAGVDRLVEKINKELEGMDKGSHHYFITSLNDKMVLPFDEDHLIIDVFEKLIIENKWKDLKTKKECQSAFKIYLSHLKAFDRVITEKEIKWLDDFNSKSKKKLVPSVIAKACYDAKSDGFTEGFNENFKKYIMNQIVSYAKPKQITKESKINHNVDDDWSDFK